MMSVAFFFGFSGVAEAGAAGADVAGPPGVEAVNKSVSADMVPAGAAAGADVAAAKQKRQKVL